MATPENDNLGAKGQSGKGQSAKGQSAKGLSGRGQSSPTPGPTLARLRSWAHRLKRDIATLAVAMRDPRTPWFAKAIAACIVAYALSPIDLIPDFIPVIGFLDELILLPIGIVWAVWLIPDDVMLRARKTAEESQKNGSGGSAGTIAAVIIIAIWCVVALAMIAWITNYIG